MKQFITALLAMMLTTGSALASAELVKQRAKQQRDINNQQQGVVPPPPATPGASAVPGVPSASQGIDPAQQSLLTHLQTDFTAIKAGTAATTDQKQHLMNDLSLLAKGVKPSKEALTKLAADLTTALAEKTLPAKDLTQLTKNINIVANCGFLTSGKAQTFVAEAQTILKSAGINETTVQAVGADLKAIVNEVLKNKPKLYQ